MPMPKGPKGRKRTADVIGNAVKLMRIATGEEEDFPADDGKDAARQIGAGRGVLGIGVKDFQPNEKPEARRAPRARRENAIVPGRSIHRPGAR
jgi:hypothetical protein